MVNIVVNYFKNDGSIIEGENNGCLVNKNIIFDYAQIMLLGKHADKTNDGNMMLITSYDLHDVIKYKWYLSKSGYPETYGTVDGKIRFGCPLYLHKFLFPDISYGYVVDHINRNRLDNRRVNLRICTPLQNSYNRSKPKNSNNKYKGVKCVGKKNPKYTASITKDGIKREIKDIPTEEQAARVYDMMAEELFGQYAAKNFV